MRARKICKRKFEYKETNVIAINIGGKQDTSTSLIEKQAESSYNDDDVACFYVNTNLAHARSDRIVQTV